MSYLDEETVPDVWIKIISVRDGVVKTEVLFDTMDMLSATEAVFRPGDVLKFYTTPRVSKKTRALVERGGSEDE